ncbi:MlaE family ABC transporter permease [Nocardia fluminea]|uniref:Phospholipid/cholesterol/gamma-HCH transport system permease protein n=1 Tax=Nocardia fluminea TaxID=134984 RepID=A0A2N3VK56_9NOCA|nr:ABC transporter permease [Nocardia fluminea]PKV82012.1 phospholipid/cholesterol/gamma-HCH transport system permease protein [Nocardia fluminea]
MRSTPDSTDESEKGTATRVLRANVSDTVLSGLATLGRSLRLGAEATGAGTSDMARMRFHWREAMRQAWFLITVTAIPGVLMAIPFGVIVSAQVGNIVRQIGADSLIGAAGGLGVIKQGAPLATGLLLGGAGAAAIAADLGARTIREEVDAMRVMGIDPVRRLVAPRMVAMVAVAPLINILILVTGVTAGYVMAVMALGVTPGSYWESFGAFTTPFDVWVSLIKSMIFGLLVVVIACQRGLEAKGGPRGVADGVNAAVILSVVSIAVANTAITQVITMFFPTRMA